MAWIDTLQSCQSVLHHPRDYFYCSNVKSLVYFPKPFPGGIWPINMRSCVKLEVKVRVAGYVDVGCTAFLDDFRGTSEGKDSDKSNKW